jgi:RNase H-like domain found in reverse transcriptase
MAFNHIKQYLVDSPCLTRPTVGETLILYIASGDQAVSAALVREEGRELISIYFVSHVLRDVETRYPPLEKMTFVLVITARKLRPYFQVHPFKVLTSSPLKKIMTDYNASRRLPVWALELSEFNISFHSRTTLKS